MGRRAFALLCFDIALLAANACDNFHGAPDVTDGGAEASAPVDGSTVQPESGMPADAATSDAGPGGSCAAFDAAADTPPTGDLAHYSCGGTQKNINVDNGNCGACGHTCTETMCSSGMCPPLMFVNGTAYSGGGLHVSFVKGGILYYIGEGTEAGTDELFTAATSGDGGTVLTGVPLMEPANQFMFDMIMDDRIYVRSQFRIYTAPLGGGPLTIFSDTMSEAPGHLAADGTHLFATTNNAAFRVYDKSGNVQPPDTAAPGAKDLAVTPNGKYVFFVARTAVDAGVVDGSYVTRGTLFRYTIATRGLDPMFDFDPLMNVLDFRASTLVVDDEFAFVSDDPAGNILRIGIEDPAGTKPVTIATGSGRRITALVMDGVHVYFLASSEPTGTFYDVRRVSRCGGPETLLVPGMGPTLNNEFPYGIALDDTYVYFGSGNPSVYRVPK
jgi:hypothetical protein